MGPELGGRPRQRRVGPPGRQPQEDLGGHHARVPRPLHEVPAARLQPLPEFYQYFCPNVASEIQYMSNYHTQPLQISLYHHLTLMFPQKQYLMTQ